MNKILELLASITENTTVEEARRIIADVIDEANKVKDDITGLQKSIEDLNAQNADLTAEVTRLQEENGRLFRERVRTATETVTEAFDIEEKTPDEEAEELLNEINY